MNRSLLRGALALAALALAPASFADSAHDAGCVRIQQVRAFAVESSSTVVVRQGKSQYRRIRVADNCPLAAADRVGFSDGFSLTYIEQGGRSIPVNRTSIQTRMCTGTPHASIVLVRDNEDLRSQCRIANIEAIDQATFEAAGNTRDNRF